MNFKQAMVGVVIAVVLISTYVYFTRVDHSNPAAVATAFTKAYKSRDTAKAAKFIQPDQAEKWREETDTKLNRLGGGTTDDYFERIPSDPGFTTPTTVAGKSAMVSADKSYTLEMAQTDGKWWVTKAP